MAIIDDKLVDAPRLTVDELYEKTMHTVQNDGLFLEFGVYRGHSIKKLSSHVDKVFYGFDSFKGLPENWRNENDKGVFACDVPTHLEKEANVVLVIGLFQDTMENFLKEHQEDVAFIHIDCDLYSSTKYVLSQLKPRIKKGTVLLFDEMVGYKKYQEHEYKAFNEFIEETGFDFDLIGFDGGERVSLIIK